MRHNSKNLSVTQTFFIIQIALIVFCMELIYTVYIFIANKSSILLNSRSKYILTSLVVLAIPTVGPTPIWFTTAAVVRKHTNGIFFTGYIITARGATKFCCTLTYFRRSITGSTIHATLRITYWS